MRAVHLEPNIFPSDVSNFFLCIVLMTVFLFIVYITTIKIIRFIELYAAYTSKMVFYVVDLSPEEVSLGLIPLSMFGSLIRIRELELHPTKALECLHSYFRVKHDSVKLEVFPTVSLLNFVVDSTFDGYIQVYWNIDKKEISRFLRRLLRKYCPTLHTAETRKSVLWYQHLMKLLGINHQAGEGTLQNVEIEMEEGRNQIIRNYGYVTNKIGVNSCQNKKISYCIDDKTGLKQLNYVIDHVDKMNHHSNSNKINVDTNKDENNDKEEIIGNKDKDDSDSSASRHVNNFMVLKFKPKQSIVFNKQSSVGDKLSTGLIAENSSVVKMNSVYYIYRIESTPSKSKPAKLAKEKEHTLGTITDSSDECETKAEKAETVNNEQRTFKAVTEKILLVSDHRLYELQEVYGGGDDQECVVCLCQPRDSVVLPCNHLAVCHSCLVRLDHCPLCRKPIHSFLQVRR